MTVARRLSRAHGGRLAPIAAALALALLPACVGVRYQRPGQRIEPRAGETLIAGRLRFFHDDREFFPWGTTLFPASNTERHVWLLRLGNRAVSAELHPESDGSLAIWLASGDYALVGSTRKVEPPATGLEVIALVRVPRAAVAAYAGELTFKTESHEGAYLSRGEFGAAAVQVPSADSARAALETRFGAMSEPPVASPWCVGDALPPFDDRKLADRARVLLDNGCRDAR